MKKTENIMETEVREYLIAHIVNAALKAGEAVMQIYTRPESYDYSLKSDKSPIIEADRVAHNKIKESLGSTRIPILSEEGREMLYSERCNWDLYWLVDPLDGTLEFINNNNEFTINIALMHGKSCIGGVIYVPYFKKLYLAGRGFGAYRCADIERTPGPDLSFEQIISRMVALPLDSKVHQRPIVAISRSHVNENTYAHVDSLREKHPDLEVMQQGSSYKFCLLAEGAIDYYARTSQTYEWDTAAGELILSEAGGSTRSFDDGSPLLYNKEELHNPWFICRGPRSLI
ncbi:MAG: 3'(2'),5'-bisphosphate nucleotidase CysQ [Rikenellaceae bacterium]